MAKKDVTEKTRDTKSKKVNTGNCPKCTKTASKRESNKHGSIRCKICTFWWHPACGGLGSEEYNLYLKLSLLGTPDLWQCQTCQVGMGDLGLRWEQTGKIVAENKAKIDILETKLEKQEVKGDKLENELKKTREELAELKKSLDVVKEDAMKMSVDEMSERESKRNNVILHGVPESASSDASERHTHDLLKLEIILRELGLTDSTKAKKDIKFIRRIGEKRQQQEARPMKVGFNYLSKKESVLESARYLNEIPDLRQISIGNDLTELQRKEETSLWRKACNQNLAPTGEMQEKGMVMKVVGPRGRKRIVMAPLKRNEEVDVEGRVRVQNRRREGGDNREHEQGRRRSHCSPITGANREPLGQKEPGNGQGAAGAGGRRQTWREEQERTSGAMGEEQLRRGQDKWMRTEWGSWSSGSAEGEEERRGTRRKEDLRPQELGSLGGRSMGGTAWE